MKLGRRVLGAVGLLIAAFGAFTLLTTLRPEQLLGLAIWLAGAVVVHDAILMPLAHVLSRGLDRSARALSWQSRALVRIGAVAGGILSLAVIPEVVAQSRGSANPTILTGDYALRLAITWAIIVLLVALGSVIMTVRTRRMLSRRSSTRLPAEDHSDEPSG
jgi:hypothetical protein